MVSAHRLKKSAIRFWRISAGVCGCRPPILAPFASLSAVSPGLASRRDPSVGVGRATRCSALGMAGFGGSLTNLILLSPCQRAAEGETAVSLSKKKLSVMRCPARRAQRASRLPSRLRCAPQRSTSQQEPKLAREPSGLRERGQGRLRCQQSRADAKMAWRWTHARRRIRSADGRL
jgi:hypothetical protein